MARSESVLRIRIREFAPNRYGPCDSGSLASWNLLRFGYCHQFRLASANFHFGEIDSHIDGSDDCIVAERDVLSGDSWRNPSRTAKLWRCQQRGWTHGLDGYGENPL